MKKVIDFLRNLFIDGEVKFTTTSNKTKIKNFSNVQLINECLILESELNNNLINSLDKCGFVLAVYEVNHYVSLLTQVVFNKNYAKKQGEMSLRSLL
jgi:hypothetical protein